MALFGELRYFPGQNLSQRDNMELSLEKEANGRDTCRFVALARGMIPRSRARCISMPISAKSAALAIEAIAPTIA